MANEKRLIDLDKAFGAINQEVWWTESEKAYFRSFLAKQPKADAVEVVHGRWNADDWHGLRMRGFMACSACNVMIPTPDDNRYCLHRLNYCPNCGAKMDGDGNG